MQFLLAKEKVVRQGRSHRLWSTLVATFGLIAVSVARAAANDIADPVAGGQRLEALKQAGQLGPMPAGPLDADAGSIAVLEYTLAVPYAQNEPGGTPNYAARAAVAQRFYETHGESYDFLVVFTNFEFEHDGPFFTPVRNDVRGLGRPLLDLGSYFGSPGRLLGYADMGPLDRYRTGGRSLDPAAPGFQRTLNEIAHQMGHQWLAQARYRDLSGRLATGLLGPGGAHWSAGLATDGSVLGGADWTEDSPGLFRAAGVSRTFSDLDLYLMGLIGPEQVAPLRLLRAPGFVAERFPIEGETSPGPLEIVDLSQVTAEDAEGPRVPDRLSSPKAFRVGFVLLADSGTGADDARRQAGDLDLVRRAYASHFFTRTRGLAVADTSLAESPAPPLTASPDLDRAVAWLLSQQRLDGRFEDADATALRDTTSALHALSRAGLGGEVAFLRGLLFVQGTAAPNLDFLARRASALALGALPEPERLALANALRSRQNPDGGVGPALGYTSSALDTALALRALASLGQPLDASIRRALQALSGLRHPGGGWPIVPGGEVSTIATAQVMLALEDWPQALEAAPLRTGGTSALLAARNPDGGFGQSPSSTHATALALQVLVREGAPPALVDPPTAWLAERQLVDGSFEGSPYQTAIVVAALRASLTPNLVVPSDRLSLEPATPSEGQPVTVTAVVRNEGRGAAGASQARLYDGSPAAGVEVATAPVPALPQGGEALLTFTYDTTDRAGTRSLFVLADALDEVPEAREDDNAASRAVTVAGLLPDLVVEPATIVVSPYPPAEGETAQVVVAVRNMGERAAAASVLRLFRGDPSHSGTLLGQAELRPLVPGEAATVDFPWDTTGVGQQSVLLTAVADATYVVAESDETNNKAPRAVEITGPPPSGPDLAVESLELRPARLTTLPATVELRAVIRNRGLDQAAAPVRIESGGETSVPNADLASREAITLTFTVEVNVRGARTFTVTADPDNLLAEANEDNNQAEVVLEDPGDTIDLQILAGEIGLSPTPLRIGEDLTITVPVHNRGTRFSPAAPVVLYRVGEAGLVPLSPQSVSVTENGVETLQFRWTASEVAASVAFAVIADPANALTEVSETNNRADFMVSVGGSDLANLAPLPGSLTIEPNPPQEEAPAHVSVSVRNSSASAAAGPFTVRFAVAVPGRGDVPIGEVPVAGLAPLETIPVALDWPRVAAANATALVALVDAHASVPEYEERDNRAEVALGVLSLPDLVLVSSEVEVEPGAPRAGEDVRLRVRVRNRGGQPAGASLLRAFDGDPGVALIQEASVPALAPGAEAVVELSWTPAAPPGPHFLSFLVDPEDAVREGDDGNNLARRTVLVQDSDLFFSDVYFSPNGDGVKDETTFGYRVGSPARLVVRNSRGDAVRAFEAPLAASSSLTWDGRDDAGVVVADGSYTFSVESATGARLGAAVSVVDSNRTSFFESERLDQILLSRSCGLSGVSSDTSALPTDDAVLVIVRTAFAELRPGLARVSFSGERLQVLVDSWFGSGPDQPYFASSDAVSPDGREALFWRADDLVAVDLTTGARRSLGSAGVASWSPNGRFLVVNLGDEARVLAREGALVGTLPGAGPWAWSPDSQWLAAGNRVARRDGSTSREIPVAFASGLSCAPDEYDCRLEYTGTEWRRDGRISTRLEQLRENDGFVCERAAALLLDPASDAAEKVELLSDCLTDAPAWASDGSKFLYHSFSYPGQFHPPTRIASADGSNVLRLSDSFLQRTPRGAAAYGLEPPCLTAATSLRNLTVVLEATALPDDKGILVRGTVADQNLDRFQLEYARAGDPGNWHPLGPASDVPFVDDTLTVWVPPAPDTYLLRLRAADLAGNSKTVTEVLAWRPASLSLPALADITQDAFLISPNADGQRDQVTFNFRVLRPDRVRVRITGPKASPRDAAPGPTVDVFAIDPAGVGPGAFTWGNAGLADGRYTVFINDLAFRLDLDSTRPDIGWTYLNLRSQSNKQGTQGVVVATRVYHVQDVNLQGWLATGAGAMQAGGDPVPASGGSRDIAEDDSRVPWLGADPQALFEASDRAGNVRRLAIEPVEERLFLLDIHTGSSPLPVLLPPVVEYRVIYLLPQSSFHLGETIRRAGGEGETIRFEYQIAGGGGWSAAPSFSASNGSFTWTADLDALGILRGTSYKGRFVSDSGFTSETFSFRLPEGRNCSGAVGLDVESLGVVGDQARFRVTVLGATATPVSLRGLGVTASGALGYAAKILDAAIGSVLEVATPAPNCEPTRAETVTFEPLLGEDAPPDTCVDRVRLPLDCGSASSIRVAQVFKACGEGSPGTVYLSVAGTSVDAATASITMGGREVARFDVQGGGFARELIADTAGFAEGETDIEARLTASAGGLLAEKAAKGLIDRTPPQVEVLLPAEGAATCALSDASGRERIDLVAEVVDASPVDLTRREERDGSGPWRPWLCEIASTCAGVSFPGRRGALVPPPQAVSWDVTGLEEGAHSARLSFCDRAGYTRAIERRIEIVRRPPQVVVGRVEGGVFSPNGDGHGESATVVARLFQDVRVDAEVRDASGVRLRVLADNEPAGPPERAFAWDGRAEGGALVADGDYLLVVTVRDGCGRTTQTNARLVVDTLPPAAAIVRPRGADSVRATVDILGFATDPHFDGYALSVGVGDAPTEWLPLRSFPYAVAGSVATPALLGRWEAPATEGDYVLRLVARDAASNEQESRVPVRVVARAFLARFAASPEAFSPTALAPENQASVTFALETRGRVFLEIRDGLGALVRRLLDAAGVVFEPDVEHTLAWDGSREGGGTVADGEYVAWVRVEEVPGPGAYEERTTTVVLDATPPTITIAQPTSGVYLPSASTVKGSVEDDRLTDYLVTASGPSGTVDLGRGLENRTAADLAPLSALADGAYTLNVEARDRASNRTLVTVPFVVDSVAPVALLLDPAEGGALGSAPPVVMVRGTITDGNLEEWVLRAGAGDAPAVLDVVRRGTSTGAWIDLGTWTIAGLPEGPYTLLLEARDRAGNLTQSFRRVVIDRQVPVAALLVPADGSAVGTSPTVRGTASDDHLDTWTLEAAPGPAATAFAWSPVATGTENVATGPLGAWPLPPDGVHTLRLTVADHAGNVAMALSTVAVDTVPPSLPPTGLEARVEASPGPTVAARRSGDTDTRTPSGRGAGPAGGTAQVAAPSVSAALAAPAGPRVVLRWSASADPDVAGYRVLRNGELLTLQRLEGTDFIDTTPTEGGVFRYAVVAEDRAGNRGPEASVTVRIDTTPPLASFLRPVAGAELAGAVTVMGSAWSDDDFKGYRLYVGASEDPATWTLLRQSSLPVLAGPLGELDARGEGSRVLVLEAFDVTGNVSRVSVAVTIDNVAPLPPTLTEVTEGPASYVTVSFENSPSADTTGYLVYRNGNLANGTGLARADLRSHLVAGSPYASGSLRDGRQCFTVVAMDRAGNLSAPSASRCVELDNNPPRARIASPESGTRFEQPLTVVADSDDADIASALFEIRPAVGGTWTPLATDGEGPFEVLLDPGAAALLPGPYELRARATDRGGRTDSDPPATTVVYGDATPPAAPLRFVARVDGADVRLTWTAGSEPDLASYRLYRDGALYLSGLVAPEHVDSGLTPGQYEYQVVAVDHDDNEGPVSASVLAIVYAVSLDHRFPVTSGTSVDLAGSGARGDASVEIEREGTAVAQVSFAVDRFLVGAVPLLPGPNGVRARGRDARGNTSIPSSERVVISNTGPPAVSGLEAVVNGRDVDLAWLPVSDPDLQGYLVRRDGALLTEPVWQRAASSIAGEVVAPGFTADQAFDEDPATAWVPPPADEASWTVTFTARVLVDAVSLDFAYRYSGGTFPWPVERYRIEARHDGRFLPLVEVTGNGSVEVRHEWPTAFATEAIRVVIVGNGFEGLAEVRVSVLDVVPMSVTTFRDEGSPDGYRHYRVSAVDRYGFEGEAAEVAPAVGDVLPPAAPTGLRAAVLGSDVRLEWDAPLEPVEKHVVWRDGEPIGESVSTTHLDASRPNGTYRYAVRAIDPAGNESAVSDEVVAVVEAPLPAIPILSGASSPAGHVVLDWTHGGAPAFSVRRSPTAGGPYELLATTADTRTFRDRAATAGEFFYVVRAQDAIGNESVDSNEVVVHPERTLPPSVPAILAPTVPGVPITVGTAEIVLRGRADAGSVVTALRNAAAAGTALAAPDQRVFSRVGGAELPGESAPTLVAPDGGILVLASADASGLPRAALFDLSLSTAEPLDPGAEGGVAVLAFSPDGRKLAYAAFGAPGGVSRLIELDLQARTTRVLDERPERIEDGAWAPDGRTLTVVGRPETGPARLLAFDLVARSSRVVWTSPGGVPRHPRWSPDGARVAFILEPEAGDPTPLIVDVATGAETSIPDITMSGAAPAWSPDGRFLAYTSTSLGTRIRTFEPRSGVLVDVTDGSRTVLDPRYDPREVWLTFAQVAFLGPGSEVEWKALDLATGVAETVSATVLDTSGSVTPFAFHAWTNDGRLVLAWPGQTSLRQSHDGTFEVPRLRLPPGDNALQAQAKDPANGLVSGRSETVRIQVPESAVPDLRAEALSSYPAVPILGQPATFSILIRNASPATAGVAPATLTLSDASGGVLHRATGFLPVLAPGAAATFSATWIPAAPGVYELLGEADTDDRVAELREDNNAATRVLRVVAAAGLQAAVLADRQEYAAQSPALVQVRLTNAGPDYAGRVLTVVEDAAGQQAARLDEREVSIAYGGTREWTLTWNTGLLYAGGYSFRTIARDERGEEQAAADAGFGITGLASASARLVPDHIANPEGDRVSLSARVENQSLNLPLTGLRARLQIVPAAGGSPGFEAVLDVPVLPPGTVFDGRFNWPVATPAGDYRAELQVGRAGEAPLANASAVLSVQAVDAGLAGVLALAPAQVLAGNSFEARATVTNRDDTAVTDRPVAVEIQSGSDFSVLAQGTAEVTLAAGASTEVRIPLVAPLAPGFYPVFLVTDGQPSLDRATLRVHGVIAPPSVDAPADGTKVATKNPVLRVNNAVSPDGEPLTYEFQLFTDAALSVGLAGAEDVPEEPGRTSWRVANALGEDNVIYWRARATDGFSKSAWTAVASFTVDERNESPSSPVAYRPLADERVASLQPTLIVANAEDPERAPLVYEFQLATDAEMAVVVASATGIASGPDQTSWTVPASLEDNTRYYWRARASDGETLSPWMNVLSFRVDLVNDAPGVPILLNPADGSEVQTLTPTLVVGNATDPESDPITYRFEVFREGQGVPEQTSPAVPADPSGQTSWVPATLADNTLYTWRVTASDGSASSPAATARFFVNLANEPPGTPVALEPVSGQVVTTATPTLRLRNTTDPDRDALTYEFDVRDEGGNTVATALGVTAGALETAWVVDPPLAENQRFRWSGRARDDEGAVGPWSTPEEFRVNAVVEPPTAPVLVSPVNGATLVVTPPTLVVANAVSPEGLALTYTFELYAAGGTSPLESATVPSGPAQTSWTPTVPLADGDYDWRARAEDTSGIAGPWMATARFRIAVDQPPLAPIGLRATPGDARVRLEWTASPEPDVSGYRVYRAAQSGGPYALVASSPVPSYEDAPLPNGIPVFYVVTARDARFESAYSTEVAATPQAAPGQIPADVRFAPDRLRAECLLPTCGLDPDRAPVCLPWLFVSIELPTGYSPASIDVSTVRLAGSIPPDHAYRPILDLDRDGRPELWLRFELRLVVPVLQGGPNVLTLTGRAAGTPFLGEATLTVQPLSVDLLVTPRTLSLRNPRPELLARLTFASCVAAAQVDVSSLRLNGRVPVQSVVQVEGARMVVKFAGDELRALFTKKGKIQVRVSGTLRGLGFVAVDTITVVE